MHGSTAFLIAFFTAAVTAAGTVYVIERFNVFHHPEPVAETVVPDLRGFNEADARTNAQASHIVLLVGSHEPSAEARPGTVVRQSIPAGQNVPREHPVSVVIADAPPKVPALAGLTVVNATRRVEELGYKLAANPPIADAKVPAGQIVKQSPDADSVLEKGKTISVDVSAGPGDVAVPKLAGFSVSKAKTELEKLGLEATFRWVSMAETPTYVVLNQKPGAGEKVAPASKIELVVNR